MSDLVVKVIEHTEDTYVFNTYSYQGVKVQVSHNDGVDYLALFPIEYIPELGTSILIEKCKLVRINYEAGYIDVAPRIDKWEYTELPVSKYLTLPIVGMLIKSANAQIQFKGPDRTKILVVTLQMRDSFQKPFSLPLIGFGAKADQLMEFTNADILTGEFTLKYRKGADGFELAMVTAQKYQ